MQQLTGIRRFAQHLLEKSVRRSIVISASWFYQEWNQVDRQKFKSLDKTAANLQRGY